MENPLFEGGRSASVVINGRTVGMIGEINSKTIENYKIRVPAAGFEVFLSGLVFE